jgi:hypothetical protein
MAAARDLRSVIGVSDSSLFLRQQLPCVRHVFDKLTRPRTGSEV